MNEIIQMAFDEFSVDDVEIPVNYLHYLGHGEPYVVFTPTNNGEVFSAEDQVQNFVTYYDFDIYSKGNYYNIAKAIMAILEAIGFSYVPSQDSPEMFENDTGYYHKTLCFSIERSMCFERDIRNIEISVGGQTMTVYKGKEAVCGIQLTVDRVWRYIMTDNDTLIVKVSDEKGHTISKEFTSNDVDSIDKKITVIFTPEQTAGLTVGNGKIAAYLNELVVLPPQKIKIKEVF